MPWLGDKDMLPKALSNARILTWGYNANVHSFMGSTSSDTILDHAHTLVAQLQADREVWLPLVPGTIPILFSQSARRNSHRYFSFPPIISALLKTCRSVMFVDIKRLYECSSIDPLNGSHIDRRRFRKAHYICMPFTWGYHCQKGIFSTFSIRN